MSLLIRCLLGPRLYRIYRHSNIQSHAYEANVIEGISDSLLKTAAFSVSMAWSLGLYTSPLIAGWMYRRGYFSAEFLHSCLRFSGFVGIFMLAVFCVRGLGRLMSAEYVNFVNILDAYKKTKARNLKEELSFFDFEFSYWPIDFRWNDSEVDDSKPRIYIENETRNDVGFLRKLQNVPFDIISYFAIHTFGRRLIYPGSTKLIHALIGPFLLTGRAKLVENNGGERFKLLTRDGNEIDSLFVNRRNKDNFPNGNTLVICCEGNCAFYECGITATPVEAGYSILGWNHPGFFGSTGEPFPDQEINAIDAVMQFAIYKLNFKPEDIVIYAWSIGGFTGTWAAMNYPAIKGLVLDATFDDLVPLAVVRMLPILQPIVVNTIQGYMNLNNAAQLCKYNGPVLMIRRTRDEILSTQPSRSIQTNRGNNLLKKLLQCRYPSLFTEETEGTLNDWLSGDRTQQAMILSQVVEEELVEAHIASYIADYSSEFPWTIGEGMPTETKIQLIIYLAHKHMMDFDSTHSVPLPARLFQMPWNPLHVNRNAW